MVHYRISLESKKSINFCVACEVFLGPFFTWVYVPLLKSNFIVGALIGSIYLSVAFLAASPTFEALAERMSRRFGFEYGQARAWGSFGYAVAALIAGFMFTLNAYLIFGLVQYFQLYYYLFCFLLNQKMTQLSLQNMKVNLITKMSIIHHRY